MRHRLMRLFGHQHWIRRGRDRLLRRLCDPRTAPALSFTVPFFGAVYRGRLDNFIDWSVFHYGAYARHELLLLRDIAEALRRVRGVPPSFFDVGANVGNHALFMAALGSPVFAFEPYAPVRERLLEKLALNPGLSIRVFDFALGDRDAEARFRPPPADNLGTGSFVEEGAEATASLPIRIGERAFAELRLPQIDILKIDVEGFERRVLAGLAATIRRDRPAILLELSDRSRREFADLDGLRSMLYPDHAIHAVGTRSVSGPYRLDALDFQRSGEVLAIPLELREALAARVRGLGLTASGASG